MIALYFAKSTSFPNADKMQSAGGKCLFTVLFLTPLVTGTKCALAYISTEVEWAEELTFPSFLPFQKGTLMPSYVGLSS